MTIPTSDRSTASATGPLSTADQAARITEAHDPADGTPDTGILLGVRVPATSANLGPGYDTFGLALDVPLVVVAHARGAQRVTTAGHGEGEVPTGDDNLVWQALLSWCAHAGTEPPDVSLRVDSAIPLQRGMGSSSAAAVAGLLLGRALTGGHATTEQLLALATEFEGHPDNAAAALVGGLVACAPDGTVTRVNPSGSLAPVLLIPSTRQATNEARAAVPQTVPTAVAARNVARAAVAFAGLAGLVPLTVDAMTDELHEPARLALMTDAGALVAGLREAGIPAALSGAGPTVLAVVAARSQAALDEVAAVVADVGATATGSVEVLATRWDLSGATVCPPSMTAGPA